MKKLLTAVVLAFSGALMADTLYWQVDPDSAGGSGYSGNDVAYAALFATLPEPGREIEFVEAVNGKVAGHWADIGTGQNTTDSWFFIELYNANGDTIYTQSDVSYSQLLSSGYISTSGLSVPTGAAAGGYNGASVPEPSGGLLMLIGGALLALRRRRG